MPVDNETQEQRAQRLQKQREKAASWIQSIWKRQVCPICEGRSWNVEDIFEIRQFEGGNLVIGGNSSLIPLVPITCDKCGYTFFLNAIKAGIIDQNGDSL